LIRSVVEQFTTTEIKIIVRKKRICFMHDL
jgi:hypothetical protein